MQLDTGHVMNEEHGCRHGTKQTGSIVDPVTVP